MRLRQLGFQICLADYTLCAGQEPIYHVIAGLDEGLVARVIYV